MAGFRGTDQMKTIIEFLSMCLFTESGAFGRKLPFLSCISVLFWGILLFGCEVRSIDPETGEVIIEERQPAFNAYEYVDGIWQEQVIPVIREEAVELTDLLEALDSNDPNLAEEEYGHSKGNRFNAFLVRGTGKVVEIDTTSRVGFLKVDVLPIGKGPDVRLQIGPVISGTALRDALPFITFDQFTNQMEYAGVSRAMHDRLIDTELRALNYSALEEKIIHFQGAFLYKGDQAVITPVKIEATDQ